MLHTPTSVHWISVTLWESVSWFFFSSSFYFFFSSIVAGDETAGKSGINLRLSWTRFIHLS